MSNFAQELRKDSNCGQDFRRENPLVGQAYNGLLAYETSYWAGCEKDTNGSYCFAKAIGTQTSSNSDSFTYYLPLGIALPAPAKPSCSQCLRNTMSIFYQASANKTLPVNKVYVDAARMIDLTCGPTFANATTSDLAASGNFASPSRTGSTLGVWIALGVLLAHYLWALWCVLVHISSPTGYYFKSSNSNLILPPVCTSETITFVTNTNSSTMSQRCCESQNPLQRFSHHSTLLLSRGGVTWFWNTNTNFTASLPYSFYFLGGVSLGSLYPICDDLLSLCSALVYPKVFFFLGKGERYPAPLESVSSYIWVRKWEGEWWESRYWKNQNSSIQWKL